MKKFFLLTPVFFITIHIFSIAYAGELTVTTGNQEVKKKDEYEKKDYKKDYKKD